MKRRSAIDRKTIHLCTWNIHFGRELPEIITTVTSQPDFKLCDFLMLQEASIHKAKEDAEAIAVALGPDYSAMQVTAQTVHSEPQANALIWNIRRMTIGSVTVLELPPFHPQARLYRHYMRFFDKKHKVALFIKWVLQKRMSLVVEGTIDNLSIRMYIVHFDIFGLATKKKQMMFLLSDTKKRKRVDIEIIAGDLNTFKFFRLPLWKSVVQSVKAAGFEDVTATIPWTYIDKRLPLRHKLDAIFVKSAAQEHIYTSWTTDSKGSDHIPLFTTLSFVKKGANS